MRWLCGAIARGAFFAAAYGQEGRRGNGWASNCEAHLDMGMRFMKKTARKQRERRAARRSRRQQQLGARVVSCRVMMATKEFPPRLRGPC